MSDFHFAGARVCAKHISRPVSFSCHPHAMTWLSAPAFYRARPEAQGGHGMCLGHPVPKELGCSLPEDMVTLQLCSRNHTTGRCSQSIKEKPESQIRSSTCPRRNRVWNIPILSPVLF